MENNEGIKKKKYLFFNKYTLTFIFIYFLLGVGLTYSYFAYQAQKYSEKVSKELDKQVYKNVTYNFTCSKCGKTWQKVFETGESDMPKELINKEKTGKSRLCRAL